MLRVLIVLAVAALIALAVWHPAPRPPLSTSSAATSTPGAHRVRRAPSSPSTERATVYVVGAVSRPGLYQLGTDARVDDALRAAGGFTPGADPAGVNLAAHVTDGEEIFVPLLGETTRIASSVKRTRSPRMRTAKTHAIVDVNSASAQALASVPGIGATVAARIVEIRQRDGAFATLDELLDVAGMTQSRLDRALPFLHL